MNGLKFDVFLSGTTACSLILNLNHRKPNLTCFNVGDSWAIIIERWNEMYKSNSLSYDHKPDKLEEKHRILKSGGRVEAMRDIYGKKAGPAWVWHKN